MLNFKEIVCSDYTNQRILSYTGKVIKCQLLSNILVVEDGIRVL